MINTLKGAVDGYIGKAAIGALLTILGFLFNSLYNESLEHGKDLASLKSGILSVNDNVSSLKDSVEKRFASIDGDIGKIVDAAAVVRSEVDALRAAGEQRERDEQMRGLRK